MSELFLTNSSLGPNGNDLENEIEPNQFHVGFKDGSKYEKKSKRGYFAGIAVCFLLTFFATIGTLSIISG